MTTPVTDPARHVSSAAEPIVTASGGIHVPAAVRRQALQEERRRLRRQRRVYAWCSLAVLAGLLAATIIVLDMVR